MLPFYEYFVPSSKKCLVPQLPTSQEAIFFLFEHEQGVRFLPEERVHWT